MLKYFDHFSFSNLITVIRAENHKVLVPGQAAQSVTCLTAEPGVESLIPAWSHTFAEIDHEIISTVTLRPSADSRKVVVCYKQRYVHQVLVNCLVKLAKEKVVR